MSDLDLQLLETVLNKAEVKEALAMVNTTDPTVTERRASDIGSALELLRKELCKNEGLEEQAIKCTIFASRTYLLGTHLLALLTCFQHREWWAEQVPETLSESKTFHSWKNGSNKNWSKALAALVLEKLETAQHYGTNDAASIFGRKAAPARKDKSSEKSSESDKKRKKKNEKKEKGSSSESEKVAKKKKKKEKKQRSSSDASTGSGRAKKTTKKKDDKKRKRKASSASTEPNRKKDRANTKDDKSEKQDKKRKRRSSEESEVEAKESKESKREQKRGKTQQEEQEKKEAAYTAWELGQLQVFLAAVEEQHGNMGNLAEARFPVQELKDFAAAIPEVVQAYGPLVPDTEEDYIPAAEAKQLVGDMVRLAKDAEKFLTQESRRSAGGSS